MKRTITPLDDNLAGRIIARHGPGGFHCIVFDCDAMDRPLNAFSENEPIAHITGQHEKARDRKRHKTVTCSLTNRNIGKLINYLPLRYLGMIPGVDALGSCR